MVCHVGSGVSQWHTDGKALGLEVDKASFGRRKNFSPYPILAKVVHGTRAVPVKGRTMDLELRRLEFPSDFIS